MIKRLSATQLRATLIAVLVLLAGAGIGIFMFGYGLLGTVAQESSDANQKVNETSKNLENIIQVQRDLSTNKVAIQRASLIAAESRNYNYQNQIIQDLSTYAAKSGVVISDFNFMNGKTTSGGTIQGSTVGTSGSSLKSIMVAVTIKSPVEYNKLLDFIYLIEKSLTKMRISTISLSRSTDGNSPPGSVSCDVFNIEVYVR